MQGRDGYFRGNDTSYEDTSGSFLKEISFLSVYPQPQKEKKENTEVYV